MSKRALKKYLGSLEKEQLEEQILDLYHRFDDVRGFYNFVFNPNEEKLLGDAKFKISKEYFPPNNRKAKTRRSVAQKRIRHFLKFGVEPHTTADLMLYNIEVAQTFSADRDNLKEAFTRSIFKSFEQAVEYIIQHNLISEFLDRILKINREVKAQNWGNQFRFERILDQFD